VGGVGGGAFCRYLNERKGREVEGMKYNKNEVLLGNINKRHFFCYITHSLVVALCYKPKGRGFKSRQGH
jgi:hypothetical protein